MKPDIWLVYANSIPLGVVEVKKQNPKLCIVNKSWANLQLHEQTQIFFWSKVSLWNYNNLQTMENLLGWTHKHYCLVRCNWPTRTCHSSWSFLNHQHPSMEPCVGNWQGSWSHLSRITYQASHIKHQFMDLWFMNKTTIYFPKFWCLCC